MRTTTGPHVCLLWLLVATVAVFLPVLPCSAQSSEVQLQKRLLHQPLYLRGFWMGYSLDFDASGRPVGKPSDLPRPGPLTLSGIDVHDVAVKGTKLVLHAERVALVGNSQGTLERRSLVSTTLMFGTFQKQYRSKEMVKITLEADATGSFDGPLQAVFANGLAELASSVPGAWRCYAKTYFVADPPDARAADAVDACVEQTAGGNSPAADAPPRVLTQPRLHGTREAAELQVSGVSEVYVWVDAHGTPSNFQVVKPLGAGLDEDTLQALSQCDFAPATRGGTPVAAGLHFSMQFQ